MRTFISKVGQDQWGIVHRNGIPTRVVAPGFHYTGLCHCQNIERDIHSCTNLDFLLQPSKNIDTKTPDGLFYQAVGQDEVAIIEMDTSRSLISKPPTKEASNSVLKFASFWYLTVSGISVRITKRRVEQRSQEKESNSEPFVRVVQLELHSYRFASLKEGLFLLALKRRDDPVIRQVTSHELRNYTNLEILQLTEAGMIVNSPNGPQWNIIEGDPPVGTPSADVRFE